MKDCDDLKKMLLELHRIQVKHPGGTLKDTADAYQGRLEYMQVQEENTVKILTELGELRYTADKKKWPLVLFQDLVKHRRLKEEYKFKAELVAACKLFL